MLKKRGLLQANARTKRILVAWLAQKEQTRGKISDPSVACCKQTREPSEF